MSSVVTVAGAAGTAEAAPSGFTDAVVTDVSTLTSVEALPDGRVIVLEQSGRLLRIDDRAGSPEVRTMAKLSVCSGSERGLLGFTLDPTFVTNGFVYVYYTIPSSAPGGCQNRVSRFYMDGNALDLASERVLVDRLSSVGGNHNGGDLEIGNDGFLYIAVGDAGRDPRGDSGSGGSNNAAQDRSLLNGKILRVQPETGLAAPGNPYSGSGTADCRLRGNTAATPSTICREIFAYGLRNPYRFAFDPNTSATRFYINDVGQNTREEVNEGALGANYGWPTREGVCPQGDNPPCPGPTGGLVDPITDYGRGSGLFITGGAFVPDGVWPARYNGAYLVSEGAFGTMWLSRGESRLSDAEVFLTARAPTDMAFVTALSGTALWYVQQNGEVHKVTPPSPAAPSDVGPLRYEPLTSTSRRFDTRKLSPTAPLRGGRTELIDLDAPAGARAALVNVTMVRPRAEGAYVTLWEPGTAQPGTATVNADAFDITANASIVPIDEDGNVIAFAFATTDMIIDVAGFFVPAAGEVSSGRLVTSTPTRLIDTRDPSAADNPYGRNADGAGEVVTVDAVDVAGLPDPDEVSAVVVVVTGIHADSDGAGFATLYASGDDRPLASNVNVNPGTDVRANLAVVPVSDDGSIDIYLERVRNVAVDLAGYFTNSDAASGADGRFHLGAPTRVIDTRTGLGFARLQADVQRSLPAGSVPADASAVVANLTMVRTGGRGFVTAAPVPLTSDVSSVNAAGAGLIRGALTIVSLGDSGQVAFKASVATDLTLDVFGWFE